MIREKEGGKYGRVWPGGPKRKGGKGKERIEWRKERQSELLM